MDAQKRVILVIVLNGVVVLLESLIGVISGSLALLSDAWHNLSDLLALVVTAIALKAAQREATSTMTYGYVRSEMMATLINASFLSLLMIWVGFEALDRLLHPVAVDGWLTMMTAAVALIVNSLSAYLLNTHTHTHHHEHDHLAVRAAFWHMASDALLSLAVVVGGVVMALWQISWIDPALSLLFVVVILMGNAPLLRRSFASLIDRVDAAKVEELAAILLRHPMVHQVHDLHLSKPSSQDLFFSAHLVLDETLTLKEVEAILQSLRHELAHAGVTHALLQPETSYYDHQSEGHCASHMPSHHP
ncbi:MAG: cation diffusion facilitator family transporter [Campylobacterales bacterium]